MEVVLVASLLWNVFINSMHSSPHSHQHRQTITSIWPVTKMSVPCKVWSLVCGEVQGQSLPCKVWSLVCGEVQGQSLPCKVWSLVCGEVQGQSLSCKVWWLVCGEVQGRSLPCKVGSLVCWEVHTGSLCPAKCGHCNSRSKGKRPVPHSAQIRDNSVMCCTSKWRWAQYLLQ